MKLATVIFLRKDGKIILARKKKVTKSEGEELSIIKGTYNGYGGKFDENEGDKDIDDTAIRELNEESGKEKGVSADKKDLQKIGEAKFFWPNNNSDDPNMLVHFYILDKFSGYPIETSEMFAPEEFNPENIPYDDMMGADKEIIPKMFANEGGVLKFKVHHSENGEYKIEEEFDKEIKGNLGNEFKLR